MILNYLRLFFNKVTKRNAMTTFCSCIIFAIFIPLIFLFAVFCYALFYHIYIPVLLTELNLNFLIQEDLHRRATVTFNHLAYEPLDPRVSYSILVELDVPESQGNKALGMLMVGLRINSEASNHSHDEIFRSTMLEYKSGLHHYIETITSLPLYLLTNRRQMQTLKLQMTEHFMENYYYRSSGAVVTVYSKDVELYGGRIKMCALFSGVRYLLYHWWMSSAIFGVATLFLSFLLAAFFVWLIYFIRKVVMGSYGEGVMANGRVLVLKPTMKHASTNTEAEMEEPVTSTSSLKKSDQKSEVKKSL